MLPWLGRRCPRQSGTEYPSQLRPFLCSRHSFRSVKILLWSPSFFLLLQWELFLNPPATAALLPPGVESKFPDNNGARGGEEKRSQTCSSLNCPKFDASLNGNSFEVTSGVFLVFFKLENSLVLVFQGSLETVKATFLVA